MIEKKSEEFLQHNTDCARFLFGLVWFFLVAYSTDPVQLFVYSQKCGKKWD